MDQFCDYWAENEPVTASQIIWSRRHATVLAPHSHWLGTCLQSNGHTLITVANDELLQTSAYVHNSILCCYCCSSSLTWPQLWRRHTLAIKWFFVETWALLQVTSLKGWVQLLRSSNDSLVLSDSGLRNN